MCPLDEAIVIIVKEVFGGKVLDQPEGVFAFVGGDEIVHSVFAVFIDEIGEIIVENFACVVAYAGMEKADIVIKSKIRSDIGEFFLDNKNRYVVVIYNCGVAFDLIFFIFKAVGEAKL